MAKFIAFCGCREGNGLQRLQGSWFGTAPGKLGTPRRFAVSFPQLLEIRSGIVVTHVDTVFDTGSS